MRELVLPRLCQPGTYAAKNPRTAALAKKQHAILVLAGLVVAPLALVFTVFILVLKF